MKTVIASEMSPVGACSLFPNRGQVTFAAPLPHTALFRWPEVCLYYMLGRLCGAANLMGETGVTRSENKLCSLMFNSMLHAC